MSSDDIVDALRDVEKAVKANRPEFWRSSIGYLCMALVGVGLWSLPGDLWQSKLRYETEYGVSADHIHIDAIPHDCAFLAAPLGEKYCHHDRVVSTIRKSTFQGTQIISYDEGQTWRYPTGITEVAPKPQSPPVVEDVMITWEKKDDD